MMTKNTDKKHDSRTFKALYDKISKLDPQMVVADAGYKTPAIAHRLLEDGIQPLFSYTRPKTKEGFFGKHEFAYDEYYDCYICPGAHKLTYSTTNRSGYKEYKSCGEQHNTQHQVCLQSEARAIKLWLLCVSNQFC